jgi:hypothetical protein
MRLHSTIVRYNGRPVLIDHHGDTMKIAAQDLCTDKVYNIDANDPGLDISSPPTGYVNEQGLLIYMTRAPQRKQKQGLYLGDAMYHADPNELGKGWGKSPRLQFKNVGDCILGNYPDPQYVAKQLHAGAWRGGAFSRKMGFFHIPNCKSLDVRYVCDSLGIYIPKENIVLLTEEKHTENATALKVLRDYGVRIEVVKQVEAD